MTRASRAALRREALRLEGLIAFVSTAEHGAVASFLGVVRSAHEGRSVLALTYDAFEPLAARVLGDIACKAAERFGARVAVEHRVGRVAVGEASLAIAAGATHRAPALDACRWTLEEIKRRLPVWKREHQPGGGSHWLEGACLLAQDSRGPSDFWGPESVSN